MKKIFIAYIDYDASYKMYIGLIPGIQGAHTAATTLEDLKIKLKEVLELVLEQSLYKKNYKLIFDNKINIITNDKNK